MKSNVYVLICRYKNIPYWWEEIEGDDGSYGYVILGVFGSVEDSIEAGNKYLKENSYVKREDLRGFEIPFGKITDIVTPYWD